MSQLVYVLAALFVSGAVSGFLWWRHHRPRSLEEGIAEFSRELKALAPEHHRRNRR